MTSLSLHKINQIRLIVRSKLSAHKKTVVPFCDSVIFLDSSSVIVLRLKLDKGTVLTASSVLIVEDILSFFIPAFKTFSMDSEVLEQLQKDRVQVVQVVTFTSFLRSR